MNDSDLQAAVTPARKPRLEAQATVTVAIAPWRPEVQTAVTDAIAHGRPEAQTAVAVASAPAWTTGSTGDCNNGDMCTRARIGHTSMIGVMY